MHRLQISLPHWQAQFLSERADREGISLAEVVRRLIVREAKAAQETLSPESILDLAGVAEDQGPLIPGKPVSEFPELYTMRKLRKKPPKARGKVE